MQDKILKRIKKCLALSESDNEHEAAAALRQARKLMEIHGIEISDTAQPDYDVLDTSEGKNRVASLTNIELALHARIAHFFGCSMLTRGRWPVFVGVAPATTIASYAASTMLRQLRINRAAMRDKIESETCFKIPAAKVRDMNYAYGAAWLYAVDEKIKDFAAKLTDEESQAHNVAANKHWGRNEDDVINACRESNRQIKDDALSKYAVLAGATDGKKVQLNHGMDAPESQGLLAQPVNTK